MFRGGPMNLLFMIGSLGRGGAERVVCTLANGLVRKDISITIVTLASSKTSYRLDNRIKHISLSHVKSIKGLSTLKKVLLIRKHVKLSNYDMCISFTTKVNTVALLSIIGLKQKIIVSERNDPYRDPVDKLSRLLRRILYRFADGYVFQTEDARDYFSKKIQNKGQIIPNPVNEYLPPPYVGERDKVIVTALRLEAQKNIPLLIDSFKLLVKDHPEYTLEIYGEGSQEKVIKEYIKSYNLDNKVYLKGFSQEIYSDILKAKMFVLPSDYEGMSNAMVEAIALGVPTISTDHPIGGARMIIEDGKNGLLTKVKDVNMLYEKMKYLIENEQISEYIGKNGLRLREELSVEKIIDMWIKYIYEVCVNDDCNK